MKRIAGSIRNTFRTIYGKATKEEQCKTTADINAPLELNEDLYDERGGNEDGNIHIAFTNTNEPAEIQYC